MRYRNSRLGQIVEFPLTHLCLVDMMANHPTVQGFPKAHFVMRLGDQLENEESSAKCLY